VTKKNTVFWDVTLYSLVLEEYATSNLRTEESYTGDGNSMFLYDIGKLPIDHTASYPKKWYFSHCIPCLYF
jgi:hypothetical protein